MTPEYLAERGIKVKPLGPWLHQDEPGDALEAGDYVVARAFDLWRCWYLSAPLLNARGRSMEYPDCAAAKAAAEADHITRVCAMLEVV